MTAPNQFIQVPRQGTGYAPTPLPDEFLSRRRDVYFGTLLFANIPAVGGAAMQLSLPVDPDADLWVTGGTQFVTTHADLTTRLADPALFATLRRTSANRDLVNTATPLRNLFGTAERPARWETGLLIKAGSTLAVTITSNHGAALDLNLTVWGTKLFLPNS